MAKKVGISSKSNLQGDSLIINYGETASISFNFEGSSSLTFSLPQQDGTEGLALITDGNGNLSFGTVSSAGNVQVIAGEEPKLAYFTGTYSLGNSDLRQGVNGNLLFPSGSTAAPGVSFFLDDDTGMMRTADNEVAIVTGTIQSAIFKSDGVQIGDVTYTRQDGPAGWVLRTDGSGNLSWADVIGATGATGPQGATGATGPQGEIGPTGSFTGTFIEIQSGTFSGLDMVQGPPLYYDVTFSYTFGGDYIVNIESDTPRDWSITNKTSTGFRVDSNSSTSISDIVYWSAQEVLDSSSLAAFVGPQGLTGATGATGATGSDGLNAPPSVAGVVNYATITGTTNTDRFVHFRRGGGTPAGDAGVVFSAFDSPAHYIYNNQVGLDFTYLPTLATQSSLRDQDVTYLRIKNNGQTLFTDGSSATPSISFISDDNTGFYRGGSDILSVTTGGVERVRWDASSTRDNLTNANIRWTSDSNRAYLQVGTSSTSNSGGVLRIGKYLSTTGLVDFDTANLQTNFLGRTYFSAGVAHTPISNAFVSGTYTLDMAAANVWDLTLVGNTTLDYSNADEGSYVVRISQDGVGGHTLSFVSNKFQTFNGLVPTISLGSGEITLLQLIFINNRAIVSTIQNLTDI